MIENKIIKEKLQSLEEEKHTLIWKIACIEAILPYESNRTYGRLMKKRQYYLDRLNTVSIIIQEWKEILKYKGEDK